MKIDCQYSRNGMMGVLAGGNSYGNLGGGVLNRGGYGKMKMIKSRNISKMY